MERMFTAFEKIVNVITVISSVLMTLLTIIVFAEVLSRYVFNFPIVVSSQLTSLLFPWLIFLGSIAVTYYEEHLAITFVREKFPEKVQKIIVVFEKLIILFFTIAIMVAAYDLSQAVANQSIPLLKISKSWLYYSLVFPFIGIVISVIMHLIQLTFNKPVEREGDLL